MSTAPVNPHTDYPEFGGDYEPLQCELCEKVSPSSQVKYRWKKRQTDLGNWITTSTPE